MVLSKVLLEPLMKEFGKRLVHPPPNVHTLFHLLDRVEYYLSRVDQLPSKPMENALCQLKKALVADDLMSHSDVDVRVAVASCISEVTRISAPVSPYDDEQMKKVFRLIVDAFERLSDTSSRSYSKRVSILASMAKLRSCVVMVDLHCDAMILEMFQHFLNSIRDYHPEDVFSDMERIMTLMLKKSDDVFVDLLSPLLNSLQMKDKDVLPIRQNLAKKVIGNCVAKLKPDMIHHEAECNGANANASGEHPANESKSLEKPGADRIPQEANKVLLKVAGSGLLWDLALGRSFQRVMTNGDTQIGNGDSLTYPSSPQKKPQCTDHDTDEAKTTDTAEKIEPDNLESKMVVKPETEPGQAIKKTRGGEVLLEAHLKEFGKRLVHPPPNVDEHFYLLDRVEDFLSRANANASGEHLANESKSLEKAGADIIPQEANKVLLKATGSGFLDLALGRSSKSVMTNDDTQIGNGDSLTYPGFPQKKPQCSHHSTDEAKTTDTAEKIEPDNLESKTIVKPETGPGQATLVTREVQNPLERSFGSSDNRDSAFGWVEAEKKFSLIGAWERRKKTKAAYKADKKLHAIESWENSKKAALEAELKKIEERPGRKKAEYVEKIKNEVALIHKDAEEKRAMIEAKYGEEILKAEEIAGKCQASQATPMTLICLLFAFGGGLVIGYWICENIF